MRCDVLAVGTELLLGQIVDTNSAWLGEQLAASGIDSLLQVKVGDNVGRIEAQLRRLLEHADARDRVRWLGPDARRPDPRRDRRRDGRRVAPRRYRCRRHPPDVRAAWPANGGEQPPPGAGSRRRDDHPSDARNRAGSDLPGHRRRRRQGDVRGARRAPRDAGDVRAGDPARVVAAQRRPVGDREPRAAHVGRERERSQRASRRPHRRAR